MKIDRAWLDEKDACEEGRDWFVDQGITDPVKGIKNLMKHDKLEWANWLIVRVMTRPQYLAYAIYSVEQVIDIFEKKYPEDKRPRLAIEAAKAVLRNDTEKTRAAAGAAGAAAGAAGATAGAAAWAAGATAGAAGATAGAAAWAAGATAWAAGATAGAAAGATMRIKILRYGLSLLTGKGE